MKWRPTMSSVKLTYFFLRSKLRMIIWRSKLQRNRIPRLRWSTQIIWICSDFCRFLRSSITGQTPLGSSKILPRFSNIYGLRYYWPCSFIRYPWTYFFISTRRYLWSQRMTPTPKNHWRINWLKLSFLLRNPPKLIGRYTQWNQNEGNQTVKVRQKRNPRRMISKTFLQSRPKKSMRTCRLRRLFSCLPLTSWTRNRTHPSKNLAFPKLHVFQLLGRIQLRFGTRGIIGIQKITSTPRIPWNFPTSRIS